jgi:hypothetical protein
MTVEVGGRFVGELANGRVITIKTGVGDHNLEVSGAGLATIASFSVAADTELRLQVGFALGLVHNRIKVEKL